MEKCVYHDELKTNVDKLMETVTESLQRQSAWQVSLNNVIELLRELKDEQKKTTEAVNNTITFIHRDFVTKREFELFNEITRNDIENVRKERLKTMAIIFSAGSAALALIQWVIGLLIGG